ncbi:undecaprenyl-diphosphate phosphatase [Rhizorhabdus dicambivorans]|uniref:Undecaprenyl-diphosphatase n=1 Tax=Rhizorhabdus dicambivorans TaxID=1850238 RepID=A0A2A4FRG5_9SPHN|nr:undecaprenyl-diphosphate phosphatase [Rhizorhabdus dicambivorans]ATE65660.1 undecaprenyl-diphosphate phosphatase [Rhizorhabdus dicambivorans]PCE41003.1 undecaprenyl-diphosphate phosphatase [Rhizorhabdus dicambivorans]
MEMSLLSIVLLGIVEGLTEFLPVSSTGHLILAGEVMQVPQGTETFDIVIQLGAILAVVVLYRQRFAAVLAGLGRRDPGAIRFTRNVAVGFLPSAVIGALAYGAIKAMLNAPIVVAVALILGGIAILAIEKMVKHPTCDSVEGMSLKTTLGIGFIQCLSMIPGVSRSGATIMGALTLGVERRTAAEYSFFLAIPTMLGATTLALWKARHELNDSQTMAIVIGFVVSFLVAIAVIRWFLNVVTRHGFAPFAWYRIIVGSIALIWLLFR